MRAELRVGHFLADEKTKVETSVGRLAQLTCDGASIVTLEVARPKGPIRYLALRPWVKLRPGKDKLARIFFELRQGDTVLGRAEAAVPLDEGGVNWEDPVRLGLSRQPASDPEPVLRVEMRIEEE